MGELEVDQLVDGHAKDGLWWPAKVVSKEGEGDDASVELKFITFGPRWNETFNDSHQAIRVRLPKAERDIDNMPERWRENIHLRNSDGTWPVKKILGKRKCGGCAEYRVRWEGFGEEDDSWQSSLARDIIEEFEESELLAAKRAAKLAAKPSKPPPAPFTRAIADAETDEVRELRITDAEITLEFVGDEAGIRTARQKTALAEAKVAVLKPYTAVQFNGLRENLARKALAAQPDRDVDLAVTPISSLRRGQRPVDEFSVMCDSVVNEILGERALVVQSNGTAVKLVPPLDFFLRARRDESTGDVRKVMELVAKAHYVALVRDHGAPGHPIFRTDGTAFEYEPGDEQAYRRAMASALAERAAAGGDVSAEFAAWSHGQQ